MEIPIGQEINILELKSGEKYYGFSTRYFPKERFRGTFTDYWNNSSNYKMVQFHDTILATGTQIIKYGPFQEFGFGMYWRVFEFNQSQSFKYYRVNRFTVAEKKELLERFVIRERRQYERGLTGTTSKDLWLPRDLVRQISLKYLTDWRIGCAKRWR
jgi:hypothetical protein